MRSKTKDVGVLHRNFMKISYEEKLEKSKNSDYRLFGGVRATIVFFPRWGILNIEDLSSLCKEIRPMMFTQLWRKWDPINIPVSTKQIDVIGFKKQNLLEDEDFDTAFPFIVKSELDHHKLRGMYSYYMNSASFRPQMSSPWSVIPNDNVTGRPIPEGPGQNSNSKTKLTYAAISRK